jgi:hypothetical protein
MSERLREVIGDASSLVYFLEESAVLQAGNTDAAMVVHSNQRTQGEEPGERTMMTKQTVLVAVLCGCGCLTDPMEASGESESSSGGETTFSSGSSSASMSSTTSAETSDGSSSSSSTSEDDGSTETTGEPAVDYALAFNGDNFGLSEPLLFDLPSYTVEAWLELRVDNAQGSILDLQHDSDCGALPTCRGWLLAIEPGTFNLLFTAWTSSTDHVSVIAGTTMEIGVGWHHVAVTAGNGALTMYLDGNLRDSVSLPAMSTVEHPLALGQTPTLPAWNLYGLTLDDVRVTGHARYVEEFEPEPALIDDGDLWLLLHFDEGSGAMAYDEVDNAGIVLVEPAWTPGYEGG